VYTIATDGAGNVEAAPSAPDASAVRDVTAPAATASSPAATGTSPFAVTVAYSDATIGATSVELYGKAPGAPGFTLVETQTFAASTSGTRTFSYTPLAGQGTYEFAALAQDAAGSRGATPTAAQTTTAYDTTVPTANSSSGAPPHQTGPGAIATITVLFSEPIRCGGSTATCAAQFTYRSNSNTSSTVQGTGIVIAANRLSAAITFAPLTEVVHSVHDRLRYDQSATAGDRVKDLAGNDLVTGAQLSPSNP
jgi:hypothetical protein